MNANPPPKKGRKFDQVLAGARTVFMREGYEGAGVDTIARDAGVSKATLYSYFPDKQALFMAVISSECDLHARMGLDDELYRMPVENALFLLARSSWEFLVSDFSTEVFRVCVGESRRFPEMGRAFYESGPANSIDQIEAYLSCEAAQQALVIDNVRLAADQFLQLCRGDLLLQKLFGLIDSVSPDELDRQARETVATFMARYGRG